MPVRLGHDALGVLAQPVVPSIYAAQLVDLMARFRVAPAQLLEGTDVTAQMLEDAEARIAPSTFAQLAVRALSLSGEPGLGFYYGLQLKLSSHGALGLAVLASSTLADAIRIAERFLALRAPYLQLIAGRHGDRAELELRAPPFEQIDPRLIVFVTEALFTALVQIAAMLLGHPVSGLIEVAYPEPAHFAGFARLWPGPVRFGRDKSRLLFAASLLDEPLQMADEVAARRALSECERELSKLGETSSLLASVRQQLTARGRGFPSLTELARARGVSPRTLKRRLSELGTSYRELLDEVRRDRALALLERDELTVEEIGAQLGYSDPANFNRAFRRWLGVSPSTFRAEQSARDEAHPSSGK